MTVRIQTVSSLLAHLVSRSFCVSLSSGLVSVVISILSMSGGTYHVQAKQSKQLFHKVRSDTRHAHAQSRAAHYCSTLSVEPSSMHNMESSSMHDMESSSMHDMESSPTHDRGRVFQTSPVAFARWVREAGPGGSPTY